MNEVVGTHHAGNAEHFFVVCVGASAGGVEALQRLFSGLPTDVGMAFVVLQHLSPDHESHLPELLGRVSTLAVEQAGDETPLLPNRVYVIPPNKLATFAHGALRLEKAKEAHGLHQIDKFMASLAEDMRNRAIGIVLSGTGADGTEGLRAIKENGGLAIAQDPQDAKFEGMPQSAATSGNVDYVLPVADIIGVLVRQTQGNSNVPAGVTRADVPTIDEQLFGRLFGRLRGRTGHDFSQYKRSTVLRRLRRQMEIHQIANPNAYVAMIEQNDREADQLAKDLLIGVTQFFRDRDVFTELDQRIALMVSRVKQKLADGVRVWVVGCATGEEAYSIAMLIREHVARAALSSCNVQIFATDIDDQALETARRGLYSAKAIEDVGPERIERHFTKTDEGDYRVMKELREMCVFSLHDILRDPPFSRLDLISCRNVFIYLDTDAQRKILSVFHYALRSSGILLLGPSEGVSNRADLFEPVDKKNRIFVRNDVIPSPHVILPTAGSGMILRGFDRAKHLPPAIAMRQQLGDALHRVLLDEFAPAAALVTEQGEILHVSGRTRKYLELVPGPFDNNIIAMAHQSLRLELRAALYKAIHTREVAITQAIPVHRDNEVVDVRLSVRPLQQPNITQRLFIVIFEETERRPPPAESLVPRTEGTVPGALLHELEAELRRTREELEATIAELEASNDELKSSNEELTSMNEEMQSANEELQTSKEELQSVNEELQTVNAELGKRIEEINRTNDDLQNLIRSTQIATLFLDSKLCIKRYTPATVQIFRLIDTDIGRPITDISSPFDDSGWIEDVRQVANTLVPRERPIRIGGGQAWYMMLVLPYRTLSNVIDGVVITFVNVTELKRAQLRASELAGIVESSQDAIIGQTLDGTITSWNNGAEILFGYSAAEMLHRNSESLVPKDRSAEVELIRATLDAGKVPKPLETVRIRKDGTTVDVSLAFSTLSDEAGRRTGFAIIARDISLRKQIERDAERLRDELENNLRRLNVILDVVPVGIAIAHDPAAVRVTANAACTRMLGVARELNLSSSAPNGGRPCPFRLRHAGADIATADLPLVRAASSGQAIDAEQYEVHFPDGSSKHIVASAVPLLDPHGQSRGAVSVFADVTAERRTAMELEESSRHKDEFLAMLGHELRNPLAAMMGALLLVERSNEPQQVKRAVAVLDRQIRHLARLVDDLLDLSRVSRGKIELQREPLNLTEIVRSVVDDHQSSYQTRGISLEYIAPESPLFVLGDRVRLCQVVGNLLSNSLKFTDRGGHVSLELSQQGEMATLVVKDTGIGIAPSALPSIFGMFVQAEPSHPRATSGLGLGLAVSKRLVEMHGGTIEAQSLGLGQGATFTIRLPISRIAPTAQVINLPKEPIPRKRILLIEDNEEIAITLRSLLEMSGHTVGTAIDGPSGIELARCFAPDIILCDIGLPGEMNGYDVARAIRSDSALGKVVLVAVTGYAREEDRARALEAGFDTHIRKPIDIDALDRVIASARS